MKYIAVLMSTYNGETYLKEQIDSILDQSGVKVKLFIRDDGSQDGTAKILEEYELSHKNVCWINKGSVCNLGIKDSFLDTLRYAYERYPELEYFSFSDQDDVWLPQKLQVGITKIDRSKNIKGALYYSNKIVVDEKLQEIEKECINYYGDMLEILWRSLASGCTFVFNRKLAEYVLKYNTDLKCLHDVWVYKLAKCIGSDVIFDTDRYILYRQHSNNVCGEAHIVDFSVNHILKIFKRRLAPREHIVQKTIAEIYRLAKSDICEQAKGLDETILNYNRSLKYKIKLLFFEGIKDRGFKLRLVWIEKVLFNVL